MKKLIVTSAVALAATLSLSACDVDKTQDAKMPDVNATGGQMPKYDVDAADVDVDTGTKKETISVPTADVDVKDADADPKGDQ